MAAVSNESLIVNGSPCSGPRSSPRACSSSARRAASRTTSTRRTTALIAGLTASIRARTALTTSTEERRPSRMSLASWVADPATQSLPDIARPPVAADRGVLIQRRRPWRSPDHDEALLVGRALSTVGRPDERRSTPGLPPEPLIEGVFAGAECTQLERVDDVRRRGAHHG